MPSSLHVLIVARQAGSAHAFAPLAHALLQHGHTVTLIGLDHASLAWSEHGLRAFRAHDFRHALPLLNHLPRPDVLLTGTSQIAGDDARFWRWADAHQIPSVAWVDTWSGYAGRFSAGSVAFQQRPRYIAVIDERAKRGLLDDGCPAHGILALGHPGFDSLASRQAVGPQERSLHLPDGWDRLVLFASEPLSRHGSGPLARGFSEHTVLPLLAHALERTASATGQRILLAVRPHPSEKAHSLYPLTQRLQSDQVTVRLTSGDRHTTAGVADLVVGMTSILLVESMLLGAPVLSLQPHRLRDCAITDDRPGIEVCTDPEQIQPQLERLLHPRAPWQPRTPKQTLPSIPRFVQHLQQIAIGLH